jgi:hypothetical protein
MLYFQQLHCATDSHFTHSHDKHCPLQTPEKKNRRVNSEEQEGLRMDPLFIYNNQETSCLERNEHNRRSEVVHHLTGKVFWQRHDAN